MELYHVYLLFVNFGILYAVIANTQHRIPTSSLTVPETGQFVRLVMDQNDNITSGRFEVLSRSGRYSPVCADMWRINEANVACRQLGFRSGAISATKRTSSDNWQRSDILISEARCNEHVQKFHDCTWIKSNICSGRAAGVVCQENNGCPAGWIAGPTSCYLIQDSVTKREFAVNKCTSVGGHLVMIETEEENHFISHVFRNENKGLILTGGVKVDGRWLWETVQSLNDSAFKTDRTCISYVKWFPGWQPGNVSSQPTNNKKDRCLFLSSLIKQPNGSYVNVDYHFWLSEHCSFNTTKKQSSGFKYICEMAQRRNKEVGEPGNWEQSMFGNVSNTGSYGCYTGIGVDYRGPANITRRGKRCLNWKYATEINPGTYPNTGLGDHNSCRNPDHDEAPWCWVSPGAFEFCDIPVCNNTKVQQLGENKTCSTKEFTCNNRSCIPNFWHCDMEHDCPSGEDESHRCDYSLKLFNKTANRIFNPDYVLRKYHGTTNETCARLCLEVHPFVCRAFSFNHATRVCILSDKNSKMAPFRVFVGDNVYELISQLTNCNNMFVCGNKRCIPKYQVCDNVDQCGDFSDERMCRTNGTSRQTQVRLNGTDNKSGRVEVSYLGEWGVICDDDWDDRDATVVCRMLGFNGTAKAINFQHGKGSYEFLLDDVNCKGNEMSIDQCKHSGWKKHDCLLFEVAGVTCSAYTTECNLMKEYKCANNTTQPCISLDKVCDEKCDCAGCNDEQKCDYPKIKLIGGSSPSEGLVELTKGGINGTICDDHFDNIDANVVCKMLGFRSGKVVNGAKFGNASGTIWMDDVDCNGKEDLITQCNHTGPQNQDCDHAEDVGVTCQAAREGSFNFNEACGIRPLENTTRVRRDVSSDDKDYENVSSNKKVSRIYGGAPAYYGMHPWQVAIKKRWLSFFDFHSHHCGGTIIGEYWILSAAHCFSYVSKSQIIIRTGDHYNDLIDKYEQEFEVDIVIIHERYNSAAYDNDIALIKVQPINGRGIVFNDYVQPACLPDVNVVYKLDQRCLISGWGEQETDSESSYLKAARVPIVDHATCNKLYKQSLTNNMVCAGYMVGGIDTCAGDSGGPLVCSVAGKYALMGITSFGNGCALANSPGVYMRVSAYVPWIKNKLEQFG